VLIPIRLLGGSGGPESPFASVAFALAFIVAGLLAVWCERRNRPLVLIALGVAVGPLSLVSIVMIPLALPAAVIVAAGAQRLARPRRSEGLVALTTAWGLTVSFMVLLVHQDPRSWSDENSGGSTGDIITWTETGISVAILVAATLIVVLTGSRNERRPDTSTLGLR
jgi:hypothetical protein